MIRESRNIKSYCFRYRTFIITGIVLCIVVALHIIIARIYRQYLTNDELSLFGVSGGCFVIDYMVSVILLESICENKDLKIYICYVVILMVKIVLVTLSFILLFWNYHMQVLLPLMYNLTTLFGITGGLIVYFINKKSHNTPFIQI